jgi:ribonucleoside-diphosphate reductase alpha chain
MLTETNEQEMNQGLLATPPLPDGIGQVELSENGRQVMVRRYVRKGRDGQPAESVEEMFWRVAYHVAKVEETWGGDVQERARQFYHLLTHKQFFPNSPTFTGAGTPLGQLAACFVLPISDDMGRDSAGIFQTLRDAALIQQTGGGNGFTFSRLRPKGTMVKSSAGQATGPVGFLRVYDKAFGEIAQGGCLLPNTLVFTEGGLLHLDEIVDSNTPGWQQHDVRAATGEGWQYSPRAYNNGVAPVLRVHTQQGLSLAGTHDHKVKIMTDEGPQWRMLKELKPGDWLVARLGELRGSLQPLRHPSRHHGNQIWPKLPVVLDEELAFFLGYLTGDGFVASGSDDHRMGVSVSHTSYLMQEMPALMERLFAVGVNRFQKKQDQSVNFVIDNRAVKEFLRLNGLSKACSRQAQIPLLIRKSGPAVVGAYLRGLFEADGALSHGYPTLMTTSPRLAEEAATLLIGLGCPVRLRSVAPGVNHLGAHPVYHIRIESSVGLQAWQERIGCDLRSRFVSCYAWQSDPRRESTYVLPNPSYWLEPVLDAVTLEQIDARGRGQNLNFRSIEPQLRRKILRYLRGDRRFTRSAYDLLNDEYPEIRQYARSPEGYWFVQVQTIQDAGQALTLDLEVDHNHTYLAYGLVTHNTRRGANMAVLRVDHPDVEEFITCKTDEDAITNFNISVGITDAFMRAVEEDGWWDLRFPDVGSPEYKGFRGNLEQAEAAGMPIKVYKRIKARQLFDKIIHQAHHNGEPGMLFLDAANRSNPVPHLYQMEATNPCGEQWLGPYENCCLGSVNLAQAVGTDGSVDWEKLRQQVVLSTIFLDDVVEANAYVPAVHQLKEAAHRARRIGLGIMGLGDLMYHAGIRYGSGEGQEFSAQVMEFVRYHTMLTSIELSRQRGPFPAITGSIYDPSNLTWQPPQPLTPYQDDWGRPAVDWDLVINGIRKNGIRNAAQTTVAPTGTIATVAGCEGYGCEPVFALAYIRHVNDNGKDLQLTYTSPLFEKALREAGIDDKTHNAIVKRVMEEGSCQDIQELPEHIRHTFVVSQDISAEEHVRMQGALQAFVDNSLSKTVNFPASASQEDVATVYKLAWELGCKGITVYVTGSRQKVVLETHSTAQKKGSTASEPAASSAPAAAVQQEQLPIWHDKKKPRPRSLHGYTMSVGTPLGKAFVTINENGGNQPFEVFINTSKAGSDTAAVSEAIGRLVSFILRLSSPIAPRDRLYEVVRQLSGIGGGRSLGFGPNRVRSLPDGVAQALSEYLEKTSQEYSDSAPVVLPRDNGSHNSKGSTNPPPISLESAPEQHFLRIGDLCPECGQAAVVNEEGCRKCYACGFSEC